MPSYDQVFVTHCRPEDSIFGEAGFSIRATSLDKLDDPLHQEAINLPPYELPPAFLGAQPYPKEAPVRLAAVPLQTQPFIALMHSVYLETDTRGRPNCYFTHIIFVPKNEFSWKDALKSWGQIQWEIPSDNLEELASEKFFGTPKWIGTWPRSATQRLPKLNSLPKSEITDKWLGEEIRSHFSQAEYSWEKIVDPIWNRLKVAQGSINPGKSTENEPIQQPGLRGYLIGREILNDSPEEWSIQVLEKALNGQTGERSIKEVFLHLGLIASLFPDEILRECGFSTYEPEKYGVSIAFGKLVVGVVHRKGETYDEFLASNGVDYYPGFTPPVNSVDGQKELSPPSLPPSANDALGEFKKNLRWIFDQKKNPLEKFQKEIGAIYQELKKSENSDLDRFLVAHKIYSRVKDFCDSPNYSTASGLLPWINKSFVKIEFNSRAKDLHPLFIQKLWQCKGQKEGGLFKKVLGEIRNYFPWKDTCSYLTESKKWNPAQADREGGEGKNNIQVGLEFMQEIITNLQLDKEDLLKSVEDHFQSKEIKKDWKGSCRSISALFGFFLKMGKPKVAACLIAEGNLEEIEEWAKERLKKFSKTIQSDQVLITECLLDRTIKEKKPVMEIAEWFKEKSFVTTMMKGFDSPGKEGKKRCLDFFIWLKDHNKNLLMNWLATLLQVEEKVPKTELFEMILANDTYLGKKEIEHFLFKVEESRIFKFLKDWQTLPDWLRERIDAFVKDLDLISFLCPTGKKYSQYHNFPFEDLANAMNTTNVQLAQETFDLVNAIAMLQNFPELLPNNLESEAIQTVFGNFERSVKTLAASFDKVDEKRLWEKLINHYGQKVAIEKNNDPWSKNQARVIFYLTILNGPDWKIYVTEYVDKKRSNYGHLKRVPEVFISTAKKELKVSDIVEIYYSWFQYKLIDKVNNPNLKGSELNKFKSVFKKVGQKFREELTLEGKVRNKLGWFGWLFFFMVLAAFPAIYYSQKGFIDFKNVSGGAGAEISGRQISVIEISFNLVFGLTCIYWCYQGLFSPLNNLVPKEKTASQKIWVSVWGVLGIVFFLLGFFTPGWGAPFLIVFIFYLIFFIPFFAYYSDGATRMIEDITS